MAKDKGKKKETEEKVRKDLKDAVKDVKPSPDALKKIQERTGGDKRGGNGKK